MQASPLARVLTTLRAREPRARYYVSAFRDAAHVRLGLANVVCGFLPDFFSGTIRAQLYRWAGLALGEGVVVFGNLRLIGGTSTFYEKLVVEDGASIGNYVTINVDAEVRIGRNVAIGPYVLIYTGTHQIGPGSNRRLPNVVAKPVTIEAGSWIGMSAIILPGVTVGHGSVVSAGAVVSTNVPPNSYVEGNPARVVDELPWGNR